MNALTGTHRPAVDFLPAVSGSGRTLFALSLAHADGAAASNSLLDLAGMMLLAREMIAALDAAAAFNGNLGAAAVGDHMRGVLHRTCGHA